MPRSLRSKRARLAAEAYELMLAAPQVVAHRTERLLAHGPGANASDHREFHRMGREKVDAFTEMWSQMAAQAAMTSQQAASAYMTSWLQAWQQFWHLSRPGSTPTRFPAMFPTPEEWQHAALDLLSKAMEPVHRRAVSNARRLRRARKA